MDRRGSFTTSCSKSTRIIDKKDRWFKLMRLTWAAGHWSARIGKRESGKQLRLPRRQWERTDEGG